ncbi:MAG: peptidoglycan DD-metalloendopeptidase family protein [Armatimonadetes bacterium]|nr:peptidoglycan DD-metalloendopeptidase family protein [Armatimonadota bacterium]MDE2207089.1 peptidoglycan DD-metalloendopeptidase family protein [Armatimonadota bacterium]
MLSLAGGVQAQRPRSHGTANKEATRIKRAALVRKLHTVRVKAHAAHARLVSARSHEAIIRTGLRQVRANITGVTARLNFIGNRLSELADSHVRVRVRIADRENELATRRQLLAARIREEYERGDTTYTEVLLQSRSLSDLLSRGYYVRRIVHSDTALMASVRRALDAIQADEHTIEVQQQAEQQLAGQYEQQKSTLAADLQQRGVLLNAAHLRAAQAQQDFEDLEQESREMTGRIRELTGALTESGISLPAFHGHFIWPCAGRITSPFGMRFHPILHRWRMHTGVDIGAHYGTPIHAAAAGVVIMAAYERGYGNCVIIAHGGGMSTLYGHCSVLLVHYHEQVSQGQVIARVGATGMATGPHLHFEVRRNGVPIRP